MLTPGGAALAVAIGVSAGAVALIVCLAFEIAPVVTSVVPVGVGVGAMQIVRGVLIRRAWQRGNAERG